MAHHGHVPGAPAGHRDEVAAGKTATVCPASGRAGLGEREGDGVAGAQPQPRGAGRGGQPGVADSHGRLRYHADIGRRAPSVGGGMRLPLRWPVGTYLPTYLCDPKEEPPPRGREWADRRCGGGRRGARRDPCPRGLSAVPGVRNRRAPAAARRCPPSIAGTRWQPEGARRLRRR